MTRLLTRIGLVGLVASIGCERPARAPEAPPSSEAASAGTPASIDDQMHAHLGAVRAIHLALINDDLVTAQARARELSRMPAAGEPGVWERPMRFVRAQALRLASTTSARDARHLSTELATVCADCHMVHARAARFQAPPEPPDDGSLRGAMARHQWAAETMWIGLVGPSTDLWRDGLAAITAPPLPALALPQHSRHADIEQLRLKLVAVAARTRKLPGQGDRARRLAQIVDICAACHAIARP